MVDKVHGHLGATRHRSPVVEYRVEQHVSILGDRLTAMQAGAAPGAGRGYRAERYPERYREAHKPAVVGRGRVAEVLGGKAGAAPRGL
jgi:hypothetical protein